MPSLQACVRCCLIALCASLVGCAKPAVVAPSAVTPSELMQRGVYLADQGDDFAAEQYFDAARSAGYPEAQVIRELVAVCIKAGRLEHALGHARAYLDRNPDDWLLRHVIATIHLAKGEYDAARAELDLLLADYPDHAESQFMLGVLLRDGAVDVEGARAAFARYLSLAPEGAHAAEARAFVRRAQQAARPDAKRRAR